MPTLKTFKKEDSQVVMTTQEYVKVCKDLAEARKMVLSMVIAKQRDGWEAGPNEDEVHSNARDCLANWDLDPVNNRFICEAALGFELEPILR